MTLLDSARLDAFAAVASEASFTRAAKKLGLTQSATSQRVLRLEEDLGVTLFVRGRERVALTAEGQALLRYVRVRAALEAELPFGTDTAVGSLRIAGFSTVMRSVIQPSLTELVSRPGVVLHTFSRELRDLPPMFRSGEADLVVMDGPSSSEGIEHVLLGYEENVLVVPERPHPRRILDHDPEDTVTDRFAKLNGWDLGEFERSYLDDIYGILDGIEAGWGLAVVSKHLVEGRSALRVVANKKPLYTGVYLHYHAVRFRPRLERAAIESIVAHCRSVLTQRRSRR